MPRIPQSLRERAIGMLNAGMTMNAVAINTGCCIREIRHPRQVFQATGHKKDRSRGGRPRVTTHDQERYIRNTHLRNRFQTATITAAKTHCTHNNSISAQTVRNHLREGGLSARRPYVGYVLARLHRVNQVNWARTHKHWFKQQLNSVLFFDESRCSLIEVMTWFEYTLGKINMSTVAYLNEIVLGLGVLSWFGRAFDMAFALISSLSKAT